jgi:hypothetical protein
MVYKTLNTLALARYLKHGSLAKLGLVFQKKYKMSTVAISFVFDKYYIQSWTN